MYFVTIFGSARDNACKKWKEDIKTLGSKLAKAGFGVVTGGGGGLMRAVNEGAFKVGGVSLGYSIKLPSEDKNEFCTTNELCATMPQRKAKLIQSSNAFIVLPGGFGTMDEFFEVLVLSNTKLKKSKIILFDSEFYAPLLEFMKNTLLKNGFINEENFSEIVVCDDIDEILQILKQYFG